MPRGWSSRNEAVPAGQFHGGYRQATKKESTRSSPVHIKQQRMKGRRTGARAITRPARQMMMSHSATVPTGLGRFTRRDSVGALTIATPRHTRGCALQIRPSWLLWGEREGERTPAVLFRPFRPFRPLQTLRIYRSILQKAQRLSSASSPSSRLIRRLPPNEEPRPPRQSDFALFQHDGPHHTQLRPRLLQSIPRSAIVSQGIPRLFLKTDVRAWRAHQRGLASSLDTA